MIETGHISKHSFGKDLSSLDSKAHSDQSERAHCWARKHIFFLRAWGKNRVRHYREEIYRWKFFGPCNFLIADKQPFQFLKSCLPFSRESATTQNKNFAVVLLVFHEYVFLRNRLPFTQFSRTFWLFEDDIPLTLGTAGRGKVHLFAVFEKEKRRRKRKRK